MDEDREIQIQVKKIPAFTVLKNGSILKNIFLLRKPPPFSAEQSAVETSSINQELNEEVLLVGRHPDCNITLEHPSISRYHLRIQSNPSSHTLSVVDLSSVHGTWVSGKRITPGVPVNLKEGDTVRMGGSSRVYELHWVPLSQAFDVNDPFVPTTFINQEKTQDGSCSYLETHLSNEDLGSLNLSLSNKNSCSDDTEVEEHTSPSKTGDQNGEIFSTNLVQSPVASGTITGIENQSLVNHGTTKEKPFSVLNSSKACCDDFDAEHSIQAPVVSETLSATEVSDNLNTLEDQSNCLRDNTSNGFELLNDETIKHDSFSMPKRSKSSCDVTEVEEHMSPCKTGNENGEIFTTVSIQTPVVVSESIFETEFFDSISKSEDLSVAAFYATETHKKDVLNQDIARDNDTDTGAEDELVNQHKIDSGLVPLALFNGVYRDEDMSFMANRTGGKEVNMGSEFEQMNQKDEPDSVFLFGQEIMKKESVFMALLDETDMDQEHTYTPDISRNKQVDSSLEAMKYASVSTNLFESLDGKGMDFFTPDKENKDPNACSLKSLRKRWKEDEHEHELTTAVNPTVDEGNIILGFSRNLSACCDEVFLSSEKENKSRPMKNEETGNSIDCPQIVQKAIDSSHGGAKKQWTMVLDTNTLLHNESLKHLKLLQGLKGTQLFIPKIVLKELMDMKSQHDLFNITTKKVSLALKWIDECMISTRWWIHMDDEIETESKVLENAIRLCKEIKDGKIVILSNDLSLKIKAMAEGVTCEEAEEFFKSLVNPFSDRFMWVGSLARGLTWSCLDDDDVLREKYMGFGLNVSNRLKGLKSLARITTL